MRKRNGVGGGWLPRVFAVGVAVGLMAMPADAQAPDRSVRPLPGPAPALDLPPIQRFTLSNGLAVELMEKRDLPLIQVNLVVRAGTVNEAPDLAGLATLTAEMLDEGTRGRSALEISDAFERMGARFGAGAGLYNATASLRAPTDRLPEALTLVADLVIRPDFPERELERIRTERLTQLVRRHDDPNAIGSTIAETVLFGAEHPYGRSSIGTASTLGRLSVAEIRAFHARLYRPDNATVIVVGDLDVERARQELERVFGTWGPGAATPASAELSPQVRGRTIYLVDRPGSAQSLIRLGRIGVPRATEDFYALQVMNTILGGSFTSRLNQNLREDKGYAYGASSSFAFLPAAGPWYAAAAVQTDATGPALAEFMVELRGMHAPMPAEEVERAKSFLAMRYPAGFQSVSSIAARLAERVEHGLPDDYFERFVGNVMAVTAADVERVAREHIDPENVAIFIVGDRAAIEEQVRAQDLGEIRFLSITDVLGPVPAVVEP